MIMQDGPDVASSRSRGATRWLRPLGPHSSATARATVASVYAHRKSGTGVAALLVECPTPYSISNVGEDLLRSLVISGFQIIEASVVKCAEVRRGSRVARGVC